MKTFSQLVNEVAQPRSQDELNFKEKHIIELIDDPNAEQSQFDPETHKFVNLADYKPGEDKKVYEQADLSFVPDDERLKEIIRRKKLEIRRKIIDEDTLPEGILATEKNAFFTAAKNAHKAGKSHFEFAGKKYPVTMKKDTVKSLSEEPVTPAGGDFGDKDDSHVNYKKANIQGKTKPLNELDSEHLAKFYKRFRKKDGEEKNESVVMESVAKGILKLNDGSSVTVSDKDAKLLNDLLNGLNPANKKKMEKVMLTDKAGYQEILGFAKEAL